MMNSTIIIVERNDIYQGNSDMDGRRVTGAYHVNGSIHWLANSVESVSVIPESVEPVRDYVTISDTDLTQHSTHTLQAAYTALYDTSADSLWIAVNKELCRRMNRDEYAEFTGIRKWLENMKSA